MEELQEQLVRLGLDALAGYGFVLAGAYALQAYGLAHRLSEDVDFFTDRWDPGAFDRAVTVVTATYRDRGYGVAVLNRAETFARLEVSDPKTGSLTTVDLAADARSHRPVQLSIGPVLAERDAVAAEGGCRVQSRRGPRLPRPRRRSRERPIRT